MGQETLVEDLVKDSAALVTALDSQGDTPTNVLWYLFPDDGEWRLLVAGPSFDALLPREEARAYEKVAKAMGGAQLNGLSIADVKLIRTDDPILMATRFLLRTPPNAFVRAHFRDNTFNGIFVKEMVLLRAA